MTAAVDEDDGWAVDEVGIAYGIVGQRRLKTLYQPVFERQGGDLVPVAVTASARLEQGGKVLDNAGLRTLSTSEIRLARRLTPELALRNHANIGCEACDLDLIVALDFAGARRAGLGGLVALAGSLPIDGRRLVFDLSGIGPSFRALLGPPDHGEIRVALDLASASMPGGHSSPLRPAILRMPPLWTRRILNVPGLGERVAALVEATGRLGAVLQVEGIAGSAMLRAALAAGVDRVQGDFFATAAAAGTDFDDRPRAIERLVAHDAMQAPRTA